VASGGPAPTLPRHTFALQQVDVHQEQLVVQLLDLRQQPARGAAKGVPSAGSPPVLLYRAVHGRCRSAQARLVSWLCQHSPSLSGPAPATPCSRCYERQGRRVLLRLWPEVVEAIAQRAAESHCGPASWRASEPSNAPGCSSKTYARSKASRRGQGLPVGRGWPGAARFFVAGTCASPSLPTPLATCKPQPADNKPAIEQQ
jgi:hypothetical protein